MIQVKVDMREFNAALKESILTSSRAASRVVDGQALALASRSLKATAKANKTEIAHILGQVGNKLRVRRKDGKFVKGAAIYKRDSFAERIIRVKRKRANLSALNDAEMEKAVRRFIAARIRSVGFIAFGWKWAVVDLVRRVRSEDLRTGARPDPKPPKGSRTGKATPGGSAKQPHMTIANMALNTKGPSNATPIAEAGLRIGIRETIADMREHMRKRLEKDLKKHSAR